MMQHLAPYQTGLWLAEYVDRRCQLCRVYRSSAQSQLSSASVQHSTATAQSPAPLNTLPNCHASFANLCQKTALRLNSGLLCARCHHSIAWLPNAFEVDIAAGMALSIQAATYYDYPMRQAIRAFKHHEDMTKLPLLLHILRQLSRPHGCHLDNSVIIAMPTTEPRLVKRGFDPVSILAVQLSKQWQIPLWSGVTRIDNTLSQQGLTRAERLGNLDNAFALVKQPPVKRLLLFDDVATTGASLQALARVLSAGATNAPTTNSHPSPRYQLSAYVLAHGSQS